MSFDSNTVIDLLTWTLSPRVLRQTMAACVPRHPWFTSQEDRDTIGRVMLMTPQLYRAEILGLGGPVVAASPLSPCRSDDKAPAADEKHAPDGPGLVLLSRFGRGSSWNCISWSEGRAITLVTEHGVMRARDSSELYAPTTVFPPGCQAISVLCIPNIGLDWSAGAAMRTERDSERLNTALWRRFGDVAVGAWKGIGVESKEDLVHALASCAGGKLSNNIKYLLEDLKRCHPALFKSNVTTAPQVPGAAETLSASRIYYGTDRPRWMKKSDPAAIAARATRTAKRKMSAAQK